MELFDSAPADVGVSAALSRVAYAELTPPRIAAGPNTT
jgi:hypothetical protein